MSAIRQLYSSYQKKKAKSGDLPEHCQAIGKTCHIPSYETVNNADRRARFSIHAKVVHDL